MNVRDREQRWEWRTSKASGGLFRAFAGREEDPKDLELLAAFNYIDDLEEEIKAIEKRVARNAKRRAKYRASRKKENA